MQNADIKTRKNFRKIVGACGICCSVCRLHELYGCCCSAGTEKKAKEKVKTQWHGRGILCLVLECAVKKEIEYCPLYCDRFPCKLYSQCFFPYGKAYLEMQKRRRKEGR